MAKRRDEMLRRAELEQQIGSGNIRTCKLIHTFHLILTGTVERAAQGTRHRQLNSTLQCYLKVGHRAEPFQAEFPVVGWDYERLQAKGRVVGIRDELQSLETAVSAFFREVREKLRTDPEFQGQPADWEPPDRMAHARGFKKRGGPPKRPEIPPMGVTTNTDTAEGPNDG